MTGRVVVLGSINVDLVTRVERHPLPGETLIADGMDRYAGGKGANQAVAAAAAGADVVMVGAVGDDDAGQAYRRRLARLGVDPSAVATVTGTPTGHAMVTVAADGENAILVVPGANAHVDADVAAVLETLRLSSHDVLLAQLEVPVPAVAIAVRYAAGRGCRVVLNAAPHRMLPADVIAAADPVVVNEHEARSLADGDALPGSLLVTLGVHGAIWDEERVHARPVAAEEVLDTTGAGDAFCGALAAALATGASRRAALTRAASAGADAVRRHGAQPDPVL